MAYYRDLSPYTYDGGLCATEDNDPSEMADIEALSRAVNVEWLEGWHPYRQGSVETNFATELFHLCGQARWGHRGIHACTMGLCLIGRRFKHNTERWDDKVIHLGSHVVIVPGPDRTYAAPDLIYHYVVRHKYRPPDEFIRAVLRSRQEKPS